MTELDEIPVSSLADRYGVHRSQVYTRMEALKRRNPELIPHKRGKKAYISRYMLECLDGMAALVQQGQTTEEAADQVLAKLPSNRANSRADSPVDTRHIGSSALAITQADETKDAEPDFDELLKMLRGLQELADNDWWLSTSQLAKVMGLNSLPSGDQFERYGFRFIKAGKNGAEVAWKVEKL
ncbi:MAG: hypothetical protein F6J97_00910 [Leptolyngbya sp. SIO4C1]|nr:hypothetical protein [Leptolyngbya sp. SIO4C1]